MSVPFTKLFSSITTSTIWREDNHTRIVWITMLAMADKNGQVVSSVPGLADLARVSLPDTLKALDKLSSPDEWSSSKEFEGRRIAKIDRGWKLLNYAKFRAMREVEERREYMKGYMRDYRKKDVNNVSTVNHSKPGLAKAEAEAEAEKVKNKSAHFVRPSLEEIEQYVSSRGGKISAEAFFDFYESVGWKIGNKAMKNWHSAVGTWERRIHGDTPSPIALISCKKCMDAGTLVTGEVCTCDRGKEALVARGVMARLKNA